MGRHLRLHAIIIAVALPFLLPSFATSQNLPAPPPTSPSHSIGVAFGGGGARGLAHVGVIQWLEEHHVPIDMTAGTSMGALVGGFFATGMSADDLKKLLADMDWNDVFASSGFSHKNIRRKDDGRSFPPRLEFGLKGGLNAPTSPNSGQQVGLLLNRISAPYYGVQTFDELPTPLRMVAVDLLTATPVVLDRGSLSVAMRASMSMPGLFPPVELDGKVLVDGGALNNAPADVVRAMGAQKVIAVNVGDLNNLTKVNYSTFGLMGTTLDAMVRANSRKALEGADIIINVPLAGFGTLDFGRSAALIQAGYAAAEQVREQLLPLAVSDEQWAAWLEHRRTARKPAEMTPAFFTLKGLASADASRLDRQLARLVGQPLDVRALGRELSELSGLDRYEMVSWQPAASATGQLGIEVDASNKPYAPPYLMLNFNLENTTSDQFRVSLGARYLRFDLLGSGSELRLDGTAGSDPGVAASLHAPLVGATFARPYGSLGTKTFSLVDNNAVVAQYNQHTYGAGLDLGVNLGRFSDARVGAWFGHLDATVHIGNPGLPELRGSQTQAYASWRLDTQDRPVVPTKGTLAAATFRHHFEGPVAVGSDTDGRSSDHVSQVSGEANRFWTPKDHHRLFVLGGGGTSFDGHPQVVDRFELGAPFHLGAFNAGELSGDHYVIATAGYLRELTQIPVFLGGPIFAGAWLESGDAFDDQEQARWRTHVSGGLIMDSLIGQVLLAGSYGDNEWRAYVSIGRLFR
jgi:NTE family protein